MLPLLTTFFFKCFKFLKQVIAEFKGDNVLKYSASLAYYTILSLAPLLVIIIYLSGLLFGKEAMSGEVYTALQDIVGADAAIEIQNAIKNIHLSANNFLSTTLGAIVLLVSATGIFGEMQDSLNKIWGLKLKKKKAWWKVLMDRLVSFSLILSLGFALIVSLALTALITALSTYINRVLPIFEGSILFLLDNLLSLLITTLLFGTIFKVLPDAKIKWKEVIFGALVTAILFTLGKYGIGYYLGKSKIATIYGAAGSIMIVMLWVYYSAAILYLGAVFTKVYAASYGRRIYPNDFAVWIKVEEVPVGSVQLKE